MHSDKGPQTDRRLRARVRIGTLTTGTYGIRLGRGGGQLMRSYIIEQARLLRQKTENRYLAVLVAAWGVNSCRKALFGVASPWFSQSHLSPDGGIRDSAKMYLF